MRLIVLIKALFFSALISSNMISCKPKSEIGLKDSMKGKFLVGTAMNTSQITGRDSIAINLIIKHFNSIVAENIMKSEVIQPVEGEFDFALSDQFVKFGQDNKMFIIGHTLVWHSQAPKWFFVDENGKDVSPEVLKERMKKHIQTVVSRYKGKVHGWDVVNEAIEDDGSWRKSKFYQILGEDFIRLAFVYAHEADPNAELYYNDYNMAVQKKRNAVVAMVNNLKAQGVKITGIGMQGHLLMDFPSVEEFEKSIVAFGATGAKVMITELDLSILPNPFSKASADISNTADYQEKMNPYKNGVPADKMIEWENRYLDFFKVFFRHSDKISRVTLWGLTDKDSWKNNFPIRGRTDYPLFFDRNYQPKPIVTKLLEMTNLN